MVIGKFQATGFLGGGNFGKVFKAKDTLLDVDRAIKIIPVKDPKGFINAINEAQVLEKCRHNHIVDIREIDIYNIQGEDCPCIITEYLPNGSVQSALENGFVTVKQAGQIIVESLLGLQHAHLNGIMHRDIKPGNILFANNGQAKLSDFGLAYGLANQTFSFAGYGSHLPPEVLEGTVQDSVSDLYSMGVTYYRLLNNLASLSLNFADDGAWLNALKKEKFPDRTFKPHIPDLFIKVAKKSLRADRANRYQNCLEFRQAIEKIPLAIEWRPDSPSLWKGSYRGDLYEIELYSKRTGYCVDFRRNARRVNDKCLVQIKDKSMASQEYYRIIRETTLRV